MTAGAARHSSAPPLAQGGQVEARDEHAFLPRRLKHPHVAADSVPREVDDELLVGRF